MIIFSIGTLLDARAYFRAYVRLNPALGYRTYEYLPVYAGIRQHETEGMLVNAI